MPRAQAEDDNDEATLAHRAARDFARAGKHAEALERREWYHENALRIRPSHYGVRLSFALAHWKELADEYPPALASLKAIRDAGVKELEAGTGNPETFHDIVAINDKLGEEAATIALFKSLGVKQADLAKKCILFVQEILIDQGEIELFSEHGGDLVRYLKGKLLTRNEVVKQFKAAYPEREDWIKKFDEGLIETTLKLVAVATQQGDTSTVARLKTLAFKRIPDPRIQP